MISRLFVVPFLALSLMLPVSAQAMRIAVIDREAALLSSNSAKLAQDKLARDMQPQRDRLERLRNEIRGLEERFTKEGASMSDAAKRQLQQQAEAKAQEFNTLIEQVQKRTQDAQQELLKRMVPTLETALEELRKAGNYDIILERRAVVLVPPEHDLTKKAVDRLNAVR